MWSKLDREIEINNYTKSNPIKNYRALSILTLIGIVLFLWIYMIFIFFNSEEPVQVIFIESNKPGVYRTSSKFLSIGLDAVVIANGFKHFNFSNTKLIAMIKYLSPGYLRIGGNLADRLSFSLDNETNIDELDEFHSFDEYSNFDFNENVTLTAKNWLKLCKLAYDTNMEIFFGLNALKRTRNGSWDSQNAETMIKFSNDHKLKLNWELGNEPNSFRHKFNEEVNATQMAKDFATLRTILNKYSIYKSSLLVGPDVTRPQHNPESQIYLKEFVKNAKNIVNKITWHQYYLNGHNTTAIDFLNPKVYDLLRYQINRVKEITNKTGKSIWLGETASAYGGGAPNLSDTFIGTFMWLDKLGLAAKMGIEVIMRQSIFHGNYSLLDRNYDPNPDWWISIIYNAFVGPEVVPYLNITNERVRLYAHCSKTKFKNSITVFGFNVDKYTANVKIEGLHFKNDSNYAYVIELQTNYLTSKNVYCNGHLLKMLPGNKLPNVIAVKKSISGYLTLPPFSIVFWIVPNVKVRACL